MAKKDQMLRLMNIVDYIKSRPQGASYEDVLRFLEEKNFQNSENELSFSEKTFQRDRKLLADLFQIHITFKRSTMTYQIDDEDDLDLARGIFESLTLVNAYKQTIDTKDIMQFERRQATGIENLEGFVHAIKNRKVVSFTYTKHWEGIPYKKVVQPYALKEFRNRWYLLAYEDNSKEFFLKTLGLDRITDFEIHSKTFTRKEVNINAMFENSFGIISTLGQKPEKLTLSFEPWQGMFVKSLPIHHSQKILTDTKDELKIELTLVPTYDFYQELLTHAERLYSIEPQSVREAYLSFLKTGIGHLEKAE